MADDNSTFLLVNVSSSVFPETYAKISPQDAGLVLLHKWSVTTVSKRAHTHGENVLTSRLFYARAAVPTESGIKNIRMHRYLMNAPEDMHVDHINGDGLDNRRENLRIATPQQNQANSRKHISGTSKFKGVSWSVPARKWRAYIVYERKQQHLGLFEDELSAAAAYDKRAKELFGGFAQLNFG